MVIHSIPTLGLLNAMAELFFQSSGTHILPELVVWKLLHQTHVRT